MDATQVSSLSYRIITQLKNTSLFSGLYFLYYFQTMEIYLIRHTTPAVERGVCYGQTDLDVTDTFVQEAQAIKHVLPPTIQQVFSSPLQRCAKLALRLFPQHSIEFYPDLKEVHCGNWEMKRWNDIPKEILQPWLDDFVQVNLPGGESYIELQNRVANRFTAITTTAQASPVAIVSHGGVMRSILSHITQTPLIVSFELFKLYYGCVVKLVKTGHTFSYEILHNVQPSEKETHRPS